MKLFFYFSSFFVFLENIFKTQTKVLQKHEYHFLAILVPSFTIFSHSLTIFSHSVVKLSVISFFLFFLLCKPIIEATAPQIINPVTSLSILPTCLVIFSFLLKNTFFNY